MFKRGWVFAKIRESVNEIMREGFSNTYREATRRRGHVFPENNKIRMKRLPSSAIAISTPRHARPSKFSFTHIRLFTLPLIRIHPSAHYPILAITHNFIS